MIEHRVALRTVFVTIVTIVAGCASTQSTSVPVTRAELPGTVKQETGDTESTDNYLGGAAPEDIVKCRKVESLGSRLSKRVCGPVKDERELFGIIDAGSTQEPH